MTTVLGVPLMDRDHAAIERMFDEARQTPDANVLAHFDALSEVIADHFAREERAMTEARVPVLLCHLELHAQLLREVELIRAEIVARGAAAARNLVDSVLPELVANHVATADTVSARFLRE
jgi:hemerythrin-like metal-binding protein